MTTIAHQKWIVKDQIRAMLLKRYDDDPCNQREMFKSTVNLALSEYSLPALRACLAILHRNAELTRSSGTEG